MHHNTKYAVAAGVLFVAASGVCVLGLAVAGDRFATPRSIASTIETAAVERSARSRPKSVLLGQDPERVARQVAERRSWVEVVDSVNMRQGPSSANAVIKVQLAGTRLRVASRDGKWVEVVEPETGGTGWVFENYVRPLAPASRRAEAGETTIR